MLLTCRKTRSFIPTMLLLIMSASQSPFLLHLLHLALLQVPVQVTLVRRACGILVHPPRPLLPLHGLSFCLLLWLQSSCKEICILSSPILFHISFCTLLSLSYLYSLDDNKTCTTSVICMCKSIIILYAH